MRDTEKMIKSRENMKNFWIIAGEASGDMYGAELAGQVKGILCAEINAGQMVQDIRLAVEGKTPVSHYGRMGGMVPTPEEIAEVIRKQLVQE